MKTISSIFKPKSVLILVGFAAGVILLLGIRVAAYKPPGSVHYHANFAVYINGQREQFKGLNYYEETETAICSVSEAANPQSNPMSRVHMHGNINDVVHVEDKLVTWGNFFTVLGWNIGNNYIDSRDAVYLANGQDKITFMLNGKQVSNVANTVIGDQDKLLVNYGDQSPDFINLEYGKIQNKALAADQSKDPASCGSHEGSVTMKDRMKHMF